YPEVGPITPPLAFTQQRVDFLRALQEVQGTVILVSNEVGMGIVPQGAISRWFVDEAGRLNQAVAALCERVQWVAAGLPLTFK
ncbi:bifunctional adenosylcobinamide kinase/adenosylcobinamide-phosphate guanylyltransferase, partial [Escherichia coli]|uniref:bifunctional adenosylcobinamide kinase/adenosylcobinamide-phosphate guanylyltransferase n=2 Tax=Pseudomonadota TaxID=1224 RepID=UPI0039E07891